MSRLIFVLAATLVLAAGCIQPDGGGNDAAKERTQTPGSGSMSADEKRADSSAVCTPGNLSVGGGSANFCAQRVITVSGAITGIGKMDVEVSSFNGDVKVHESSGEKWGFTATLRAKGSSPEEASARLNDINFQWSHTDGAGHFIQLKAKQNKSGDGDASLAADLDVSVPPSILMVLTEATGNGDVSVDGGQTDGLSMVTGNGDVKAKTRTTGVDLRSGNGDIEAKLVPTGSARLSASTGNGNVVIALPEDASHGYQADASTGNGKIDMQLKDGKTSPCPTGQSYTPPCNHRTFETNGFSERATQLRATIAAGNGDVTLKPS